MIGEALKNVRSTVAKAVKPAPRKPAPVPNQGYGKFKPTGAPQTIPAADRARLDALSAKLRQQTPKMPMVPAKMPTPVTPPKPATGIRSFDDPKMVNKYRENVARAKADPFGSFNLPSKPGGGRTMGDILLGRGSPAKPVGPGPGLGGGRPAKPMMKKGGAVKKAATKGKK